MTDSIVTGTSVINTVLVDDTIVVRDTIVRLAVADQTQWPTWSVILLTAISAVAAGAIAQWFRVLFDSWRRREQVRQMLRLEVLRVRDHLKRITHSPTAWQVPPSDDPFWRQLEQAMRGFDIMYVDLVLFHKELREAVIDWFFRVRAFASRAGVLTERFVRDLESGAIKGQKDAAYERDFGTLAAAAIMLLEDGRKLANTLATSAPSSGLFRRIVGGESHPTIEIPGQSETS